MAFTRLFKNIFCCISYTVIRELPLPKTIRKAARSMARFTNQAQLSYNGTTVNSNVTVGEVLDTLTAAKAAVDSQYTRNDGITYAISLVNTGTSPLSGITVTDNLGAYTYGADTLYPLTYVDGSVHLYLNGVLQTTAPTVSAGPPLVFSGITLPANSNMLLLYEAGTNPYTPQDTTDSISNAATVTGVGITPPVTVTANVTPLASTELTITKFLSPSSVNENGSLTYTFLLQNFGNTPASAETGIVVNDTFTPVLTDLSASLNGTALTETTDYTYTTDGAFATVAGVITVPAATYSRAQDGSIIITPGVSELTVTGTV